MNLNNNDILALVGKANKLPKAIFTFFWISKLAPKQIMDWIKIDDTHNRVQSVSCKYVYDITTFFSVMF
jgi:hypothetical protein